MLRRAFLILLAAPLAACVVAQPYGMGGPGVIPAPLGIGPASAPQPGRQAAALLPLTGSNAALGKAMLQAVQLALDAPGSPPLDVEDTGGTPDGAASAARAALAKGAGLFIGPLTAPETAAVAPIAQAARVPVLALTSDVAQARPGVWTLGLTPAQQVRALVGAVQGEGKSRFAAVVPQNAFGGALADALVTAASEAGLPPPTVRRYGPGNFPALDQALRDVSDYANRRGAIEARQREARAAAGEDEAAGRREAAQPEQEPVPPPPFDALLLGTVGPELSQAAALLAPDDIAPSQVRVLGPAQWEREAARVPALAGAWYAAPDPAARKPFEAAYAAKYGVPPRPLASLAYDAGGLARASFGPGGFDPASLLRPEGFAGSDGVLALLPDGRVRRGLAIFEVAPEGPPRIVQPAQQSLAPPGT